EIHPAALTDGTSAAVISCRELRSCVPYTNKRLSILRGKQDKHTRGSSRWKRLQRRKNRFLVVDTVDEHYTSQTCPRDGHRTKPKGRVYTCHVCGFRCARDIVGAANILS